MYTSLKLKQETIWSLARFEVIYLAVLYKLRNSSLKHIFTFRNLLSFRIQNVNKIFDFEKTRKWKYSLLKENFQKKNAQY